MSLPSCLLLWLQFQFRFQENCQKRLRNWNCNSLGIRLCSPLRQNAITSQSTPPPPAILPNPIPCRHVSSYSRDLPFPESHREPRQVYGESLLGRSQVSWTFFLLLLTSSASTCLQHSRNLGTALWRFPVLSSGDGRGFPTSTLMVAYWEIMVAAFQY